MFGKAESSDEFRALVPDAIKVLRKYVGLLKTGCVSEADLVISKSLSKSPEQSRNLVRQAVAAQLLAREGGNVHAGQSVSYVLTKQWKRQSDTRAMPMGLTREGEEVDNAKYVDLLVSADSKLLGPADLDEDSIRAAMA